MLFPTFSMVFHGFRPILKVFLRPARPEGSTLHASGTEGPNSCSASLRAMRAALMATAQGSQCESAMPAFCENSDKYLAEALKTTVFGPKIHENRLFGHLFSHVEWRIYGLATSNGPGNEALRVQHLDADARQHESSQGIGIGLRFKASGDPGRCRSTP